MQGGVVSMALVLIVELGVFLSYYSSAWLFLIISVCLWSCGYFVVVFFFPST